MKRFALALVVLALIAVVAAYAFVVAPRRADALLGQAIEAPKHHNWEGIITTKRSFRGKEIEARVEVVHKKPDKDRLEYVDGDLKGLVVVKDSGSVTIVDEGMQGRGTGMEGVPTATAAQAGELLKRNYRPKVVGREKIAGREADILSLRPRESQGESKRLWIDGDTKVTLKTQTYDAAGDMVGESEFEDIRFVDDIQDSVFIAVTGYGSEAVETSHPQRRSVLEVKLGFPILEPEYLPPGYVFDRSFLYTCPCGCGMHSALLSYTDGANRVSIFETNVVHEDAAASFCGSDDPERRHRISGYGSGFMASAVKDGIVCVVVGNVTKEALAKVADSLGEQG